MVGNPSQLVTLNSTLQKMRDRGNPSQAQRRAGALWPEALGRVVREGGRDK